MNINFILARFEPRSKKIRRPICSGFFREKNETIRRQSACSLWALWVAFVCRNFIFFFLARFSMELTEHWKLLLPGILGLISPINCSVSPPAFLSTIQWPHYSRLVGRLFPKMSQVVNILAFVSHGRSLFHVLLCERVFFFFLRQCFKNVKPFWTLQAGSGSPAMAYCLF